MNATSFINASTFTSLATSILDLENSNLPIDYFTSVLPRAQYGDESAVSVGFNESDALFRIKDAGDATKGAIFGSGSYASGDSLQKANSEPVTAHGGEVSPVKTAATGSMLVGFSGDLTADASMRISALRSATAFRNIRKSKIVMTLILLHRFLHILVLSLR